MNKLSALEEHSCVMVLFFVVVVILYANRMQPYKSMIFSSFSLSLIFFVGQRWLIFSIFFNILLARLSPVLFLLFAS